VFAIRRTFNRFSERPKLCPMEEPKVKLVVFNHGEVPTTHSGKEQREIYYLESVDFTHTATPRGYNACPRWDLVTIYYTDVAYQV